MEIGSVISKERPNGQLRITSIEIKKGRYMHAEPSLDESLRHRRHF